MPGGEYLLLIGALVIMGIFKEFNVISKFFEGKLILRKRRNKRNDRIKEISVFLKGIKERNENDFKKLNEGINEFNEMINNYKEVRKL